MKRFAIPLCAALGLFVLAPGTYADGPLGYGGQQPWWNIFARRPKLNPEEERLQRFWHDYYNSMQLYYGTLDKIDWVAYYKNHGYQINTGGGAGCYSGGSGGPQRIQFAPVLASPGMQFAVGNGVINGPSSGPQQPPPGAYTPGYGPPGGFGPPPGSGPPGYGPPQGYGGPPPGYNGPETPGKLYPKFPLPPACHPPV